MGSVNRYDKAMGWLKEPEKHLHSLIIDEDGMASAVVIGETGEYVVAIGPQGKLCGCLANRNGATCSHLVFFASYLKRNLYIPHPSE